MLASHWVASILAVCSLATSGLFAETVAPQPTNRLAGETSPYLLMHAHNPVDWFPWGEEAFAKARQEKKLVFLSIGYSSCYWCHVMERESFMNDDIAKYLKEHFICIKVDREERPDIDDLYMTALQIYFQLVGSPQGGGWPLSMFLLPGGDPVFGGTYFPPRSQGGRPGFLEVLKFIQKTWENSPDKLRHDSQALVKVVRQNFEQVGSDALDQPSRWTRKPIDDALRVLGEQFDPEYGGFGYVARNPQRPKFPEPSNLLFLLQIARADNPEQANDAQRMLCLSLEKMAQGGIYDHLGGGFHRYSTDRYWLVPHFEKMLYDNGQLATVYSEAYQLTQREDFARVVHAILNFVLAEMTSDEGGFYAALDAETDEEEGRFYVWTTAEMSDLLSDAQLAWLDEVYGTSGEPVFEGNHVLLLREPLTTYASQQGKSVSELLAEWEPIRSKLLETRNQRERPLTDTKILTAWNGIMISGFADAGRILDEPKYLIAATHAADLLWAKLRQSDGRLLRTYRAGEAKLNGYLDDYAFFVNGLLALYKATGDPKWLDRADQLTRKQIELFWDDQRGGFFFTSHDHEALFARGRKQVDGALPSGNSISAENLLLLAEALNRSDYREKAAGTIAAGLPTLDRAPAAAPRLTGALHRYLATENQAP